MIFIHENNTSFLVYQLKIGKNENTVNKGESNVKIYL